MIEKVLVTSETVVLASGGARGITAECVKKLAERSQCKFVLLGRSSIDNPLPGWADGIENEGELKRLIMQDMQANGEKPTPPKIQSRFRGIQAQREIESTLDAIDRLGGQAEYINADVANLPALREKLAGSVKRLGPITGIIHGAGSLADKLIEDKTEKDFETVYTPKVKGLENMLKCVSPKQLNFLVLFSSIVGVYGNIGQSDYAIANEILNKSAYLIKRKNPNCHVVSINWGPWDSGMVTPELKKAFEANNITVIPADVGASLLVEELAPTGTGETQIVVGSPISQPAAKGETELHTHQIHRCLSLEDNPFLLHHVIGSAPVLPATCAAAWVINACEQIYPGYTFHKMQSYKVLKGIVFDENIAREYILDLKETEKTANGEITFDAVIWSLNKNNRKMFHYSLQVVIMSNMPEAPQSDFSNLLSGANDNIINGKSLYADGTLFHGPSFQGVERVLQISPEQLTVEIILPELETSRQGQFPVQTNNPFINDAIVQCLLIWTQHYDYGPCLPARLEELKQYKPIPFNKPCYVIMKIRSQSETAVVCDIIVQDENDQIYLTFTALEGTISPILKRFIGRKQSNPTLAVKAAG